MALQLQAVVAMNTAAFTGGIAGMQASLNKFAGMAMTMFGGVAGQVGAMWAAFGPMGGVAAGLQAVTKAGATFEQEMKNVQSVTGLVGDEFDRVYKATREAAVQTSFTAKEAAEAMYALGSSGMSSAEVLEATLLPALKLAGATQSDTKLATEAMTAAMAVFKLGAQDAANVADLFAGSIASSPATMERLSHAMKYAGPSAAAFGMSLRKVVDEISAFHVVGLRGQMAGTAFRQALIKLTDSMNKGSSEVGKAMKGWNASTEGLTGAVKRLEEAGVPAAAVIQELGARAGPGIAALLKLGSAAMGELTEKITRNADVQKMYATQMSSLMGQFQLFKAQVEEVAQKLFVALSPALHRILQGAKNLVTNIETLGRTFKWMVGPVAQMLPLLIGGGGLLWAFGKLAAMCPFLGGSLVSMWAGASKALIPAQAQLAAVGLNTMPMVTTASATLNKALHANSAGFFKVTEAAYHSTNRMALYSGAVTTVSKQQANAILSTTTLARSTQFLQVGVMGAAAAFAGWKLGSWIRDIQVADYTIGGIVDNFIAAAMGVSDFDTDNRMAIESAQRLVAEQKKMADAAAKIAEEEAKRKEAAYQAMIEASRAADVEREALMRQIREQKDLADQMAILEQAAGDVALAQATLATATISSAEAQDRCIAANQAMLDAETALGTALEEKTQAQRDVLTAQENLAEAERKAADATRTLSIVKRAAGDADTDYAEGSEEAADAIAALSEAMEKNQEAANNLEAAKAALTTANDELKAKTDAVAKSQSDLVSAFNEANAATDAAITEHNTLIELIEQYDIPVEDARDAFRKLGVESVEAASRATRLGISFKEAADDAVYLAKNGGLVAEVLSSKFGHLDEVNTLVDRFGRHALEVAKYMSKFKVSAADAAKALGVYGAAVEEADDLTEPAIEAMSRLGDETIRFGKALTKIDDAELTRIYNALKKFAVKLSKLPPLDISWARDLGMIKLPSLGGIDFWDDNFRKLCRALMWADGLNLDFSWASDLGELNLPPLGNVGFWDTNFKKLIAVLNIANGLKLDFSWAEDLGNLQLPHIGNVDSWETRFDKLITALSNVPAIDLTWMDSITNFKMPETEFWGAFGTTFATFADTIDKAPKPDLSWIKSFSIIDTVDVEKIKAIASAMQGLPTGTYNASVIIGWEDNSTLSSINGHLATLAGMKGVIWA